MEIITSYLRMLQDPAIVGASVVGVGYLMSNSGFLNPWQYTRSYALINGGQAALTAYLLNTFAGYDIKLVSFAVLSGLMAQYVVPHLIDLVATWSESDNTYYMGALWGISSAIAFALAPMTPLSF